LKVGSSHLPGHPEIPCLSASSPVSRSLPGLGAVRRMRSNALSLPRR
jgi:hypothetical protein